MLNFDKLMKNSDIPCWTKEPEMIEFLFDAKIDRKKRDFYTVILIEKIISRIEFLEEYLDQSLVEKNNS